MRGLNYLVRDRDVWLHLGWRDLRVRFASTLLGPWWSVANLAVTIVGSVLAVSIIAGGNASAAIPRLTVGLVIWTFISACLIEATLLYEESRSLLLNTELDELTMVFRLIWRNLLIFFHNLIVVTVVLLIFDRNSLLSIVVLVPFMLVLAMTLVAPTLMIARMVYWRTEFRALIPPLVQFGFFVTPVLWMAPPTLPGRLLLEVNPAAWAVHSGVSLLSSETFAWEFCLRIVGVAIAGFLMVETVLNIRPSIKKFL